MPRFPIIDQLLIDWFDHKSQGVLGFDLFQIFGFAPPFTPISLPDTTVQVPDGSPLHYYLKIDGVVGDVTDKYYKGAFTVDGFNFGETSPNSIGSGAGTGKATFTPLTVDISSLSGLAPLFGDAVSGKVLKSAELVGVDTNGEAVYDIKLTNAQLTSFENTPGGNGVETALTFDFQKVTLTDHKVSVDGELGQPETTTINGAHFAPGTVSLSDKTAPVPDGSPLHYYLKIDGVVGDVTDKYYKGAFTVDGFNFGETSPNSIGSGAGTGKATFTPLTVDISSLSGLAPLFGDAVSGKVLKSAELVGVDTNGEAVYDIKLTNAQLTSFENTPGGNGVETALTFDFQKVTLTDHKVSVDGELGQPETTTINGAHFAPGTVSLSDKTAPVPDGSPLHYYLKIDGVVGDVTDKYYKGAFTVDGFNFGETSPNSIGSGAGTGKATFTPLTVDISSLSGLAPLFGDAVSGKVLKSAELVGVDTNGEAVYDIKLTNAQLTSFENTPGGNGVETALTFDFQKVTLTDHKVSVDGELGQPETTTINGAHFAPGTVSLSDKTAPVPDGSPLHYYLKIDGVVGDVTDKYYKGAFTVDGFNFGETSPNSIGSGAGTGKATFTPLTVDISSLSGLAPLFGDAVSGKVLKSAELVGVDTNGEAVYDIKLTNAQLTSFENTPGGNGVETALTFDFQKVTLTDHKVSVDGELGQPETTTINGAHFAPGTVSLSDKTAPVPDGSPLHYYLKIDGVVGDVTDKYYKGAFTVDGFNFGETSPNSIGSGAGTGKATFTPLTVDISSLSGLAPLFGDAVSGKVLKSAELVGVDTNGEAVYDIKLTNAQLTSFENTPGGNGVETALTFDFQKVTLTDHKVSVDGELGQPETTTINGAHFAPGTVSLSDKTAPVPDGSPLHYYLKIDGVVGDVTDKYYKGAFTVDGFNFGETSPNSIGSGAGTGKATFTPLTVDISSLSGLAPLFGDAVSGKVLKSAELVGVDTNGEAVYDIKLTNAVALMVQMGAGLQGVDTSIAFEFQKITVTDHGMTNDGTIAPSQIASFTTHSFLA